MNNKVLKSDLTQDGKKNITITLFQVFNNMSNRRNDDSSRNNGTSSTDDPPMSRKILIKLFYNINSIRFNLLLPLFSTLFLDC